ncbi:MAG TPA: glucose-1-phosphate thymidylyltransferase RfbA [Candidatus Omnitrophota bacterium]|nr:glucose-1-phosphate thymidylyltransferase RfbA [Candidatus Omnitrophota bacterium]
MKGIILAGGKATRLHPITKGICKQLLPIYDKPMIYYPLSALMLAKVRDILIIASAEYVENFRAIFGDGRDLGLTLSYAVQDEPKGIAEAFLIAEDFIKGSPVALILGDNIFYGDRLRAILQTAAANNKGATIFGYYVKDPERYGVVQFDSSNKVISLEEKPAQPQSNWAVTGLYFYDQNVVEYAKQVKPSQRGELEITDLNKLYLEKGALHVELLGRGYAWLDTGTYESLINASLFIKTIEDRQGLKIGCVEEIAYRMKYISAEQLTKMAHQIKTSYGEYLLRIVQDRTLNSL